MTTRRNMLATTGAAIAIGAPRIARAQTARKLTIAGLTPASLTELPIRLAIANGYFEREHLDIDFVYTGSLMANVQNVVTGNADFANLNFEALIAAIENGVPIVGVASTLMKYCYSFLAAPSVTKPVAVKGKTIVSDLPNSICSLSFVDWAKRNGLSSEDFDLTYVGTSPGRLAALSSGAAVAASLTQPLDLMAISRGYHRLFDLATDAKLGFSAFGASKSFVANNGDTIRAFIRAASSATADIYNARNTDAAANILVQAAKVEPTLARQTIGYLRSIRAFSTNLGIPDVYVQNTAAFLVRAGTIKSPALVGTYVDRNYCRA